MSVEAVLRARRAEVLTLVLPIALLSKNSRDKLHYRARHALRIDYQNIVSIKYPRKRPTPDYKQHVVITRLLGLGARDFDRQNLAAGSSVELIDSLVHLGWLVDDSPKWLEPEFRQERHKTIRGPATMVTIQAAP